MPLPAAGSGEGQEDEHTRRERERGALRLERDVERCVVGPIVDTTPTTGYCSSPQQLEPVQRPERLHFRQIASYSEHNQHVSHGTVAGLLSAVAGSSDSVGNR